MYKYTLRQCGLIALALLAVACHRGEEKPDAEEAPTPVVAPAAPEPAQSAPVAPPVAGMKIETRAERAAAGNHIELSYSFQTKAPPDRAYAALTDIAHWWDADHTYSGDAGNLSLDARAGGCWCERLADGGSVQHMIVISAMPGRMLRLSGGLGPLQSGALNAVMTWTLKPATGGSIVAMTYLVDGFFPGGLDKVRGDVDQVLSLQVDHLQRRIDGGNPVAAPGANK